MLPRRLASPSRTEAVRMSDGSIVVAGASAGGIEALRQFVATLPADLPAPVAVVVHLGAGSANLLPRILTRSGRLPAHVPRDGEPVECGKIAVAPAGRHLLVREG